MKIKSTIVPGKPTCFSWSYMIGDRLQVLRYCRPCEQSFFSARWTKFFMAHVRVGRFEIRWHLA